MAGNTFGTLFRITTFGESHGPLIGVVIDGCYSGVQLDLELIRTQLSRRKPGQSAITTQRMEDDEPEIVSGVFNGITTGAPLTILIRNKDQRPTDYDALKDAYRPSHADYTYEKKYGIRDHRGSGRASARETAARVAAGAVAIQMLNAANISIDAYVSRIGNVSIPENVSIDTTQTYNNILRCPHEATAQLMQKSIEDVRAVSPEMADQMENQMLALESNAFMKIYPYLNLVFILLSFLGALMMWNRKRNGFYLYSIAEILPYSSMLFMAKNSMNIPGIPAGAMMVVVFLMVGVDVLFVYLYSRNLKEMTQ